MARTLRLISCASCLLLAGMAAAQPAPGTITMNIVVNPPYTAAYADYVTEPNHLLLSVVNNSQAPVDLVMTGTISTVDGSTSVSSDNLDWATPITAQPGLNLYDGTVLESILSDNPMDLDYQGISEEDIRMGLLPEGEYQICLKAYAVGFTDTPVAETCSNIFTISYPPPPDLLAPECDGMVEAQPVQLLLFQWVLPSGPPMGAMVSYHFKLVILPEDADAIDPLSALESSNDPVAELDVTIPQLLYDQTQPPLIDGRSYAWRVRAVDITGQHPFQNDGWSTPCTFTYRSGSNDGQFSFAYPPAFDTIPWDLVPLLVHFEPHPPPEMTQRFHSTLTLYKDGTLHSVTERRPNGGYIQWASGPFASQAYLLHQYDPNITITEEQSHYINMYRNDAEGDQRFQRGSTYNATAEVEINTANLSEPIEGQVTGAFVRGMGRPAPEAPANEAVLPRHEEGDDGSGYATVHLRFQTARPPAEVLPPYPIWIIPETGPPTQTQASVDERWFLQVARDDAFADVVHTADGRLGQGLQLNDPACNAACVEAALYKEETVDFTPNAEGSYYWRVRWMLDPSSTVGPTYHDGPTWKFTIGSDSTTTEPADTLRTTPDECLAECQHEPVPLAERIPVTTVEVGDTVHVGLFDMRITQIQWTAASAKGKGTIEVPFMHAPLRVAFNGIHINAAKRMYDGVVKGEYDNADVIPAAWLQGGGLAAGFNAQDAEAIENFVNAQGRLVSQMTMGNPMGLPIALDTPTPDGKVYVGILALQFTDTLATLNAAMRFPLPEQGINIGLGAMDIPFHPEGPGCVSQEAVLYLADDIRVDLSADHDSLVVKAARFAPNDYTTVQDSGAFVAWDCQGFRALRLAGEVRFSKEHLVEDLPNGDDGPAKIVGSFMARTGRHGFLAQIDFNKPFHLKGAKGWGFDVQEAWYDLASYANPPNIQFPKNYAQIAQDHEVLDPVHNTVLPLWEGVYVKRAMVRLPEDMKLFDHAGRVTAQVDNLIYDGDGLSASLKVANVIGPDEGNLDGWGYSMDTLQLDIIASSFSQAGFKGRVHLPVTDTLLVYSAMVQQDLVKDDWRAEFLLHPKDTIDADLWKARLQLDPTSYIQAVLGDDSLGTFAKLELNGKLTIDHDFPEMGRIDFPDLRFEHLSFQTRSPYTNADDLSVFSFTSPQKWLGGDGDGDGDGENEENPKRKAGGFPVTITKVEMTRRNPDGKELAGLAFDVNLNLTGDVNAFTATTRIAVLGELNTEAMHRWGHHSLELDSIGVSGDVGIVKVKGGLRFFKGDSNYGDGIKGALRADFVKGKLIVQAMGQFGNKNNDRYWFVDAQVAYESGIDVYPGFTIYGFGGGAWYHMRRTSPLPSAQALVMRDTSQTFDKPPGYTLSDVTYVPDPAISFGFDATMLFGNPGGGHKYNADVAAGADFSSSGGVSHLFLSGNVYFMTKKDERTSVPVRGSASIQFDYPNEVFNANFQVYINIKNGLVRGSGDNDLAGAVSLLISPDEWHLFAGTPQSPVGLKFAGLFETNSYFMMGMNLPAAMPPPQNVMDELHISADQLTQVSNNPNGIAFGSRMSAGDTVKFVIFRFRYAAELGFDLALLDHSGQTCLNLPPGEEMGVDGWYANGQVYGYFQGAVDIHVDIFGLRGNYEIFDVGAALWLQGGLPNPSWMQGSVGGHYSILAGLVSGDVTLPFEVGTRCLSPSEGLLAGLNPLGDLSPHNGATGVDCGVNPEAVFNVKVNKVIEVYDEDWNLHKLRVVVDKFELKEGSNLVTSTMNVAPSSDQAMLVPAAFLKAQTAHTVSIRLKLEELNTAGNVWVAALKDGQPVAWDSTHQFTTGPEPTEVDPDYVDYTYPFTNQRCFLQGECNRGFIQIRQDMTVGATGYAIFNPAPAPNTVRSFKVIFTPVNGGPAHEVQADIYGGTPMRIFFDIPPLINGKVYACQLISRDSIIPGMGGGGRPFDLNLHLPANWTLSSVTTSTTSQFNNMAQVRLRSIQGYTVRSNEHLLYTFHFGLSQYNTLDEKAVALQNISTYREEQGAPESEVLYPGFSGERFDAVDIYGAAYGPPGYGHFLDPYVWLSDARTDNWSMNWNKPLIYDYYNALVSTGSTYSAQRIARGHWTYGTGGGMVWQATDEGIPPVNTVFFAPNGPRATPLGSSDTAPDPFGYAGGVTEANEGGGSPSASVLMMVKTAQWVHGDYLRMQTITSDIMAGWGSPFWVESFIAEPLRTYMKNFLNSSYWRMYSGDYHVLMHYRNPPSCTGVIYMAAPGATLPPPPSATYHHSTGTNPNSSFPTGPIAPIFHSF